MYLNGQHSWVAIDAFAVVVVVRLSSQRRRRPRPGNSSASSRFTSPSTQPHPTSSMGEAATGSSFTGTAPGWFTDPFVRHEQRYWSGTTWTEHVIDGGTPATDPPPPQTSPPASQV
ncbi:MAG TPA: DUF2510 domain-containing protein [Acidimicrobiales bacterium]